MTHALPYPNLDLVLTEAVATIAALRAGGRRVLLRRVHLLSRTPIAAAPYGPRPTGRTPSDALADVLPALPRVNPNRGQRAALERLG
jgi:hypothetical protein